MSEVLRNAYGLHRAGRLAEAARAYDEIITADPLQFDAHFLLGGEAPCSFAVERAMAPASP